MSLLRSCLSLPLPSPLPSSLPQITAYPSERHSAGRATTCRSMTFLPSPLFFNRACGVTGGLPFFYKHVTPPELSSIAIEFQSLVERVVFIYHTIDVPNGAFLRLSFSFIL
jgi:hypothetical protein